METAVELSEHALVARKLVAYAKRAKLRVRDAAGVLKFLLVTQGLSLDEIASITKVTRQAIAYNAKKLGLDCGRPGRPESIISKAVALGYKSVESYFRKNGTKTFEAMSEELEVSSSTIQRHYESFLQSVVAQSA